MKEFDLEKAKAGAKVCTRDGASVRIICFDRKGDFPIVALLSYGQKNEEVYHYDVSGRTRYYIKNEGKNLVMESTEKEGWINIYNIGDKYRTSTVYSSKEIAERAVTEINKYVATIHIEWEE